ncbi:hypothetical protein ACFWYW_58015 [Nonomuraea sp. NPDC059023]|uniref:hypothetical protein n=1 Tax=unclassified Nonomuraea TaxID=2593643 RepID=UPI00367BE005
MGDAFIGRGWAQEPDAHERLTIRTRAGVVTRRVPRRLEADRDFPGQFGVRPLPGPGVLGGWNLAVSSCSRYPKEARALIHHFTTVKHQTTLLQKAGFAPSLRELYSSSDPYVSVIRRGLGDAITRPVTPSYSDVTRAVQQRLHPVLREGDVLSAMRWLRDDLLDVLGHG